MITKNEARLLILDLLYEEIDKKSKSELEEALNHYPELRQELRELQETKLLLGNMPAEQPEQNILVIHPDRGGLQQWLNDLKKVLLPQSTLARTTLGLAAVLILALMVTAVASLHFQMSDARWSVTIGSEPPASQEGVDEERVLELLELVFRENIEVTASLIGESRALQDEKLQETAGSIYRYFENRRQEDLILIEEALTQLEEENTFRHLITNEALSDLYFTLQQ
ncbi:MAG: hypothetical protein WD355_04595 [Balneolaceae bacterium]